MYIRLIERIKLLALNPYPKDRKMLSGKKEKIFRARVRDNRILYIVFDYKETLLISDIDKREKVYD